MWSASEEKLRFGKYKGHQISLVPTDYLRWVLMEFRKPYEPARQELERRSTQTSGPDAVGARQALNEFHWKHARRLSSPRPKWKGKAEQRRKLKRTSRRFSRAPQPQATLKQGCWIVGENYEAARVAWLTSSGNPHESPF
jgi:hypothetical protein